MNGGAIGGGGHPRGGGHYRGRGTHPRGPQQPIYTTQQPTPPFGYPPQQSPYPPHQRGGGMNPTFNPRGGGRPHSQKIFKIASHVQFDKEMVFDVNRFIQPGEVGSQLSSIAINCLPPLNPNEPPRVSVYTGDLSGNMREFNFTTSWIQSRSAKHEGPVTCLLTVENWLFVGIQSPSPQQGIFVGIVKAYNLINGGQFLFQDSLPFAHMNRVRCICVASTFLITGGGDGQVKAWNYVEVPSITGQLPTQSWNLHGVYGGGGNAHDSEVVCMSGKLTGMLVTASFSGAMKLWGLVDGRPIREAVQAHIGAVAALDVLSVDANHQYILSCGSNDNFIRLWNATDLTKLYEVPTLPRFTPQPGMPAMDTRPPNPMTCLKIVQYGQEHHLFVGFFNGSVQVYHLKDVTHFEKLGVVDGHSRQSSVLEINNINSTGLAMLCLVTENGLVNWFRFA